MGMGSDAIGIVGPKTRTKAQTLGVTLPQPRTGTSTPTNTTSNTTTNDKLVTKTVAELQKLLYGVGWTTKKLDNDPRFGPQTVKAWKTSTKTRNVPQTINRVDATHAQVSKIAYKRMVADQPKTQPKAETDKPKETVINAPDKRPTKKEAAKGLKK